MLGAGQFFVFHHVLEANGEQVASACVYKPPGQITDGAVEDVLKSLSTGPSLPDVVLFLTLEQDKHCDLGEALTTPTVKATMLRFRERSRIQHATFSLLSGELVIRGIGEKKRSRRKLSAEQSAPLLGAVITSGLRKIFSSPGVILEAPPGYTYQKPSGKSDRFFLQPAVALTSSSSVAFTALALYLKFGGSLIATAEDLRYLFIDTMSISPVGYALRDLIGLVRGIDCVLVIESFHSYGGMRKIGRPLPGTSICIISASTSMAMHARWISEMEVPPKEVVTLLTVDGVSTYADGALYALPAPYRQHSEGPPQLSISLVGENFFPSQEPPKKVMLSERDHPRDEVSVFRELAGGQVFDIWRKANANVSSRPRPLFVDASRLIMDKRFDEWLTERLTYSARAVTKAIVHQPDAPSERLAAIILDKCYKLGMSSIEVTSASAVETASFQAGSGVIICAAVIGKGSQLLEISASLRDRHTYGPRLYLAGLQVTETREESRALRPNLVHSKKGKHEFEVFRAIAVGSQLGASFENERAVYYHAGAASAPSMWLLRRAELMGTTDELGSYALLPCGETDAPLALREGFAYWDAGYQTSALHAEVLGTVGVLLQRAREEKSIASDRRLSSQSYRHVVLSPENFARYNDGVIQAALLRNAFPSELDYRTDTAASSFLHSLILRQLARAKKPAGEGLLEFLLAISLGRLKLMPSHEKDLLNAVAAATLPEALRAAVNFILSKGRADSEVLSESIPF